jgi:hypothetical protein
MQYICKSTQYAILKLFELRIHQEGYPRQALDLVLDSYPLEDDARTLLLRVKAQLEDDVPVARALADCALFDEDIRLLLASEKIGVEKGKIFASVLQYLEHFKRDYF